MKKFLIKIAILLAAFGGAGVAQAAPVVIYQKTILPELHNTYDLGTTTQQWRTIFVQNASTTALSVSGQAAGCAQFGAGGSLLSTGVACGSGSGGSGATTTINGASGPSFTFATGTATGIGLNISTSTGTVTFTPVVSSGYGIPLVASSTQWSAAYASTTALTPAYIRGLFSSSATGLTYTSATGDLSLTSGYTIPLSASTTNWNGFYNTPSTRITAGTNLSWSGNTLNASGGGSGNSAWTIGNGLIYNATSSDNVGVGTTTPFARFTVVSGNPGAPYTGMSLLSGAAGNYTALTVGRTSPDAYLAVAGGAGHYVGNAGTGDAMLLGTGKVLIGSNLVVGATNATVAVSGLNTGFGGQMTPLAPIDIAASVGPRLLIYGNGGTTGFLSGLGVNLGQTPNSMGFFIGKGANFAIDVANVSEAFPYTSGYTTALTVTNGRQVGIGTTSPAAVLSVRGSSSAPTVPTFTVATSSGSTQLTVLANGNVGIGRTPTSFLLESNGTIAQYAAASASGYLRTNASGFANSSALNPGISFFGCGAGESCYGADLGYNSSSGRYRTRLFTGSSGTDVGIGYQNANPPTAQSDFTEVLTVTGTGRVGLGTTTPLAKLHVTDGAAGIADFRFSAGSGAITPTVAIANVGSGGKAVVFGAGTSGAYMGYQAGGQLYFKRETAAAISGNTTGAGTNVGIIDESGRWSFGDNIAPTSMVWIQGPSGTTTPTFTVASSSGTVSLTSLSNGNVGVGTTTPGYPLTVQGDTNQTGAHRINGDAGTAGSVLTSNGSSAPTWNATSSLGIAGYTMTGMPASNFAVADGSVTYLHTTVATTLTNQFIIPKSGTVKAMYAQVRVNGVTSSGEDATLVMRLNDTTDYNISTVVETNAVSQTYASSTNIAVTAGDLFMVRLVAPTYATNPTNVSVSYSLYIE